VNVVPTHPRRVAITSACAACGGTGWVGDVYGRPCRTCRGNGTSTTVHQAFERADLVAALERMNLETSTRRPR
jgi:DnaJ-class molecular chaperone